MDLLNKQSIQLTADVKTQSTHMGLHHDNGYDFCFPHASMPVNCTRAFAQHPLNAVAVATYQRIHQ